MIKSMTGYGQCRTLVNGREIFVEIRSVNSRYCDLTVRVPKTYGYLEEKIKSLLRGPDVAVFRGKIEINVGVSIVTQNQARVMVDMEMARGYVSALQEANRTLNLVDDIALSHLISLPDIFSISQDEIDETALWNDVRPVARQALTDFLSMRTTEGNRLKEDIVRCLNIIRSIVLKIEKIYPVILENYRQKLMERLQEALSDQEIDLSRILMEAAVFADRTAINEELVRLQSHLHQFDSLLNADAAIGKKMDFLVQEMNREVNTIASKSQDISIIEMAVELKSEIEKIREQIQNIE